MRFQDLIEAYLDNVEVENVIPYQHRMTYAEYLQVIDSNNKSHPSEAYNWSVKYLKTRGHRNDIPEDARLVKQLRRNGLDFKIYYYKSFKEPTFSIRDEDGLEIGAAQDEWGATLIWVAQEYRSFGFGKILFELWNYIRPLHPTGGMTNKGANLAFRAYQDIIRKALINGSFRRDINSGKLTKKKYKEIIDSARLEDKRKPLKQKDYSKSKFHQCCLYDNEVNSFTLYDERSIEYWKSIQDGSITDAEEYHMDKFILGTIMYYINDDICRIKILGSETQSWIKPFLLSLALNECNEEGVTLYVEPEDYNTVISSSNMSLGDESVKAGYKSSPVSGTVDGRLLQAKDIFKKKDKLLRKANDQYGMLEDWIITVSEQKFRSW